MKMKNKKAEQIAAKKKHRESLKSQRRSGNKFERSEPFLTKKPTILIVCEGENTEPSYFSQFRLATATIKPIGEGYNTISLVNRANELSHEKQYEQVWCVFDKDDFNNNDFNNAILMAQSKGFGIAYSNQAFEYWLILHFNDHQGGIGNIDPHFNDRSSNEDLQLSTREAEHRIILFRRRHPPVNHSQAKAGQLSLQQAFVGMLHIRGIHTFGFFYQR